MLVLQHLTSTLDVKASRAAAWADRAALHVATWALLAQELVPDTKWRRIPRGYRANYPEREAHVYLVAVGAHQATTNDGRLVLERLEKECGGSAVVVNLRDLGRLLAECAGQPLATIEQ
jgi:hypothetical protein